MYKCNSQICTRCRGTKWIIVDGLERRMPRLEEPSTCKDCGLTVCPHRVQEQLGAGSCVCKRCSPHSVENWRKGLKNILGTIPRELTKVDAEPA